MARRPAYNTKAEIARRAAARTALLSEFESLGDEAEPLAAVISAFVQFHRRLSEYKALRGRPFDRYARDFSETERMVEARERWEIAFSLNHVVSQACEFAQATSQQAAAVAINAGDILRAIEPCTAEELEMIRRLYEG
jgi:hypothetical protein